MDTTLGYAAPLLLAVACFAYVFWTRAKADAPHKQTQAEHLQERKAAIFENLRDLNFEFRAGKYPQADYDTQRAMLEAEAARVVGELEAIDGAKAAGRTA